VKATTTAEAPPMQCGCARCRTHAAGLGPGPYTPAEYALIAPPVVGPSNGEPRVEYDADVIAATEARDAARVAFDLTDAAWLEAVSEHQTAVLLGDPYVRDRETGETVGYRNPGVRDPAIDRLAQAERDARERRDAAWSRVVKANDRIVAAQMAARLAIVEAARNGQTSKRKGR
jgi:hypothetical protein